MLVISDIHGQIETFKALLEKLPKDREIICVGDIIDRGHGSLEVFELIQELGIKSVKGNHEALFQGAQEGNRIDIATWARNGGVATLKSFHKESDRERLYNWCANLPLTYTYTNPSGQQWMISHAACQRFVLYGDESAAIWDRNLYGLPKELDIINIFGHNPDWQIRRGYDEDMETLRWICIDTAAGYSNGHLTAYDLDHNKVYSQKVLDSMLDVR